MGIMEATTMAPLLLRNLITSLFFHADKSLLSLSEKYKLLQIIRHLLLSSFLFFLRILPSLAAPTCAEFTLLRRPRKAAAADKNHAPPCAAAGDSGIARALSQLLSLVNDVPVSSRKYEVVRSLAERLLDDNLREGVDALRQVNRTVLSTAFERTLRRLEEAAVLDVQERDGGGDGVSGPGSVEYGMGRVLRVVKSIGDVAWTRVVKKREAEQEEVSRSGCSAEKLAAEVLWLAQKLAACGYVEEAVCRWASASKLAWISLSAEPRLQGSLVKVSAFLFKQAKDIGSYQGEEDDEINTKAQTKLKMLMSWLPLLCRASNGTDTPILTCSERAELEKVLEEMIDMLEEEEQQEKVLSLWLHHFTYCPSSDWPNLHACYAHWCTASRKLLIFN